MKFEKFRANMTYTIISGIVLVFVAVIFLTGYIGYSSFTKVLISQYSDGAYLTADTALALFDGSRLEEDLKNGGRDGEYEQSRRMLSTLCNRQDARFIYVIIPDADYNNITYVYNVTNDNSGFEPYEIGFRKTTTNDEYKETYRRIYEEDLERAMVVRDQGFIESGSHITELVPVKDGDKVTGILCVQKQMDVLDAERLLYVKRIAGTMLLLTLIVAVLYGIYLHKRLLKPIKIITAEAQRFAHEQSAPQRSLTSVIAHRDEIGVLAKSIDSMTEDTLSYMENLTEVTRAQEKIATQLDVARQIQQSSLPRDFSVFDDRREFDIYASMTPALEVGGDFYDFFLIDDDHLAMVIADVSDKGVGAALFMMQSKILIHNRAIIGGTPAEILGFVNNQLCQSNDSFMFVTVWLGIMEISTGKTVAANAGHEYPMIKSADGGFEIFHDDPHTVALGLFEDMEFTDYTFTLEKGGAICVYTDGVAEAEDSGHNRFGLERTLDALNKNSGAAPKELIEGIKRDIASFVLDAPQFDDTTILCVKRM